MNNRKTNGQNSHSRRTDACCAMLYRAVRGLKCTLPEVPKISPEHEGTTRASAGAGACAVFSVSVRVSVYSMFRSTDHRQQRKPRRLSPPYLGQTLQGSSLRPHRRVCCTIVDVLRVSTNTEVRYHAGSALDPRPVPPCSPTPPD